jgi:hypothetical protein
MLTILVDVRSPKEYNDGAIPGSINLPFGKYDPKQYEAYRNYHICLVCESGNRANQVCQRLEAEGFQHLSLFNQQMETLSLEVQTQKGWSIDRQFRLALALFLGVFLLGYIGQIQTLVVLPVIIFGGLLFSAITDNCYLKEFLASLPWNRASPS